MPRNNPNRLFVQHMDVTNPWLQKSELNSLKWKLAKSKGKTYIVISWFYFDWKITCFFFLAITWRLFPFLQSVQAIVMHKFIKYKKQYCFSFCFLDFPENEKLFVNISGNMDAISKVSIWWSSTWISLK